MFTVRDHRFPPPPTNTHTTTHSPTITTIHRCRCGRDCWIVSAGFDICVFVSAQKALHETSVLKDGSIRDSGFGDSWYAEREELHHLRGGQAEGGERGGGGGGGGGVHKRDNSLDSLNSLSSQAHSISSDTTIKGSSEGRPDHLHLLKNTAWLWRLPCRRVWYFNSRATYLSNLTCLESTGSCSGTELVQTPVAI